VHSHHNYCIMSKHPAHNHIEDVQSARLDEKTVASKNGDIALNLASELDAGYAPSPEVECQVRRKIDFILLPLISCTATLSFLDKVSNNYANNVSLTQISKANFRLDAIHADTDLMQYGLSTVLNMHGNQFSWSASVFYFAFLVWQPAVSLPKLSVVDPPSLMLISDLPKVSS
jgi:hypothetical protein